MRQYSFWIHIHLRITARSLTRLSDLSFIFSSFTASIRCVNSVWGKENKERGEGARGWTKVKGWMGDTPSIKNLSLLIDYQPSRVFCSSSTSATSCSLLGSSSCTVRSWDSPETSLSILYLYELTNKTGYEKPVEPMLLSKFIFWFSSSLFN